MKMQYAFGELSEMSDFIEFVRSNVCDDPLIVMRNPLCFFKFAAFFAYKAFLGIKSVAQKSIAVLRHDSSRTRNPSRICPTSFLGSRSRTVSFIAGENTWPG